MEVREDYIDITQAAWLLNDTLRIVQNWVAAGKLQGISGKKILIDVDSLERFFYQKVKKYENAVNYFKEVDKAEYWKNVNFRINVVSDEPGYLSIPQTAYLVNATRQGVHYILEHKNIDSITKKIGNTERVLICEKSIKDYVDEILEQYHDKYKNLLEYLDTENKEEYWSIHSKEIREKITEVENQRRQNYRKNYVKKDRKQWENLTDN